MLFSPLVFANKAHCSPRDPLSQLVDAPNVGRSALDELRTGAAEFRLVEGKKQTERSRWSFAWFTFTPFQGTESEIYAGLRILDPKFSTPRMKAALTRPWWEANKPGLAKYKSSISQITFKKKKNVQGKNDKYWTFIELHVVILAVWLRRLTFHGPRNLFDTAEQNQNSWSLVGV